jgi:formylglycine-generating enzyme required for sulfatase activity
MVAISAGSYRIGCDSAGDKSCFSDEGPVHEVRLSGFAVMKHEVTMRAYDECIASGACPEASTDEGCNWQRSDFDKHPINCVSWHGADRFCRSKGWRLPTEVEWEVAARGEDAKQNPWGSAAPDCRLTAMHSGTRAGCSTGGTLEVGSKKGDSSWIGARDMGGNVREWTASRYRAYPGGEADTERSGYVNRGGSYLMKRSQWSSSSTRNADEPGTRVPGLGFRCAASL